MAGCLPCFGASEEDRASLLKKQVVDLKRQLESSESKLEEERKRREVSEQQEKKSREKNQQTQRKVWEARDKRVKASILRCCAGICGSSASEAEMQEMVKKLKKSVADSKTAVEKIKAQKAQLQAMEELEAAQASEPAPEPESVEPVTPQKLQQYPFASDRTFFRGRTPAECRDMKVKITDLFATLMETEEEKYKQSLASRMKDLDNIQNEADILAGEVNLKSEACMDFDLSVKLRNLSESTGHESKAIFGSIREQFRSETPANQRKIKSQIQVFMAELKAAEEEAMEEHKEHQRLHRKLSSSVKMPSKGTMASIGFGGSATVPVALPPTPKPPGHRC